MFETFWQNFITALGGFGIMVAALSWLLKGLFSHYLSKDIEFHKANLELLSEGAIKRLEYKLEVAAKKREILFVKLHEKRAEILVDLYDRLNRALSQHTLVVLISDTPQELPTEQETKQALDLIDETTSFFSGRRLYFSRRLADAIDSLLDLLRRFYEDLVIARHKGEDPQLTFAKVQAPAKKASFEGHKVLGVIEEEFRSLFGVQRENGPVGEAPENVP